jgi:hypothetical protein
MGNYFGEYLLMAFKTAQSIIDEEDRHRANFNASSFPTTGVSGQTSLFSQSPDDEGSNDYGNNSGGANGYGAFIAAKDGLVAVYHPTAATWDGSSRYDYGMLFIYNESGTELVRKQTYTSDGGFVLNHNAADDAAIAMGGGVIAVSDYAYDHPISPNPTDSSTNFLNSGRVMLYSYGGQLIKQLQPHYTGEIQNHADEAAGVLFGRDVAIGDGLIVVGCSSHDGSRHLDRSSNRKNARGTVYVYNLRGEFLFELEPPGYPIKSFGEEHSSESSMQFGWRVAVGNGVIAVNGITADIAGTSSAGLTFLYDLNGRFQKAIRPPAGDYPSGWSSEPTYVGYQSLEIGNGRIYVGSSLSSNPFLDVYDMSGNHINQVDTSFTTNMGAYWPLNIAAGYDRLLIGDRNQNTNVGEGKVYICDRDGTTLLTTVDNPYQSSASFDEWGHGLAIMNGNAYIGLPRYSNNYRGFVYKRPLETTVDTNRKSHEDVVDMILGADAYADSDRTQLHMVEVTYHVIGGGGGGAGGETGNVPADYTATGGGDGGDSYIQWYDDRGHRIISYGGYGGDDNVRDRSQFGESSNWLGTTSGGGPGGANSDFGNWANGQSATSDRYGSGGGSGGTSFETDQGGEGGSAAIYKTGTVKILAGTEITIRVGERGAGGTGDTTGGLGAHGRVNLVINGQTYGFTETYTGTFTVPTDSY